MARLGQLGFELVGATDTTLRDRPDPDVDPSRSRRATWIEMGYGRHTRSRSSSRRPGAADPVETS